ncbi:Mitochondrial fission protein [Elasticomyces elasticus]|nr:Mitochondrial fission protein [Elasticomyces elasticus]
MSSRGRSSSPRRHRPRPSQSFEDSDAIFDTRPLEAFGRTVQATASHILSGNDHPSSHPHDYTRSALTSVHRTLGAQPRIQRSVFELVRQGPRDILLGGRRLKEGELEYRAATYLPEELVRTAPVSAAPFSLFDGFKASLPETAEDGRGGRRKKHGRRPSKLLEGGNNGDEKGDARLERLQREKERLDHRLEMMGIRKTMCSSEIREIDGKIGNLNTMRGVVLDRLAGLEQEEREIENESSEMADQVEMLREQLEDEAALAQSTPSRVEEAEEEADVVAGEDEDGMAASFMSESIYQQLPKVKESPPKPKRKRLPRRTSTLPILHEHMDPGTRIKSFRAHGEAITAMDFDAPFGTLVTASQDDSIKVWDLNAGKCLGALEGHLSSVRCLQTEESIVATGSLDASIRLWDLSLASAQPEPFDEFEDPEDNAAAIMDPADPPYPNPMANTQVGVLNAHIAEITALHFSGNTLVSGSADKTLRQWDLEGGRCVQTLDVLWAAAQTQTPSLAPSSALPGGVAAGLGGQGDSWWKSSTNRLRDGVAGGAQEQEPFIGALQVYSSALAVGTADGMVRLWDLRSGTVHRSLVGHTGGVVGLQFDDAFLVTGSKDRSVRIWDLRTGTLHDAFAYENPITSMQFDSRRIVAAAGEDVVKVYDKADGRLWDCGASTMSTGDAEADVVSTAGSGGSESVVERVRIRDRYLVEGRRDGAVAVWSC